MAASTINIPAIEDFLYYNKVAITSFIITFCSFFLIDALLQYLNVKAFSRLPKVKQCAMIATIPSTIHAVIVSPLATYALVIDTESIGMHLDTINGKSIVSSVACSITVGYMVADLVYMLLKWKYIGEIGFIFHHLMSSIAYLYVTNTGTFRYFAMIRLLAEYSTLFVNIRLILYELGLKTSAAYFYNGLFMLAAFFGARILPLPFYLYHIYLVHNTPDLNNSGYGKYFLWVSTLVLDTLNTVWFHKMIIGALKVIHAQKPMHTDSTVSQEYKMKQG